MKTTENAVRDRKGFARLTLVIVLIFAVMGASIWAVSKKTSDDMADAAILNLNENLNLVESTVEAIQDSEAQFQRLFGHRACRRGRSGRRCGALGQKRCRRAHLCRARGGRRRRLQRRCPLRPGVARFQRRGSHQGAPVSQAYVNAEGSWAYTVKCPIERDGVPSPSCTPSTPSTLSTSALPQGSTASGPCSTSWTPPRSASCEAEGMGERDAGHVNLEDFYRANNITDPVILSMVADGVANRENVMFAIR